MRKDPKYKEMMVISEQETELFAGDGVSFEMKFHIDLEQTDAGQLEIAFRCGKEGKTVCLLDFKKAEMHVDRNIADGWSRGRSRSVMDLKGKKELDVHVLSDQSSLEIFTDDYQNNHSNNIFAGNTQNRIRIRAYSGSAVLRDIETYGLELPAGTVGWEGSR